MVEFMRSKLEAGRRIWFRVWHDEDGDRREWYEFVAPTFAGLVFVTFVLGVLTFSPFVGSLASRLLREELDSFLAAVFCLWVLRLPTNLVLQSLRRSGIFDRASEREDGRSEESGLMSSGSKPAPRITAPLASVPPSLAPLALVGDPLPDWMLSLLSEDEVQELRGTCGHEAAHAALAIAGGARTVGVRVFALKYAATHADGYGVRDRVELAQKKLRMVLAGSHWETSAGFDLLGSCSDYEDAAGHCLQLVDAGAYPTMEAALEDARREVAWVLDFGASGIERLTEYLMEHREADDGTIRRLFSGG